MKRQPNGSIKYNESSNEPIKVTYQLRKGEYDAAELKKAVDTSISSLATEQDEQIERIEIS